MKAFHFKLPEDMHKRFKLKCVQNSTTMQKTVKLLISYYIENKGENKKNE